MKTPYTPELADIGSNLARGLGNLLEAAGKTDGKLPLDVIDQMANALMALRTHIFHIYNNSRIIN